MKFQAGCLCLFAVQDSVFIGARFDADVHGDACRLAFYGRLLKIMDGQDLSTLKVFKVGQRQGAPPNDRMGHA